MKLDLFLLIVIGFFVRVSRSDGGGGKKHVHVKIHVPVPIHHHKHTHTIYKKPKEEKKIVIHKHVHKHGHGHKHGHKNKHHHKHDHGHKHDHKHGHKNDHKHKHKHDHHHKHDKKHHHHHHGHHDHKDHRDWSHGHGWAHHRSESEPILFNPSPKQEYETGFVPSHNEVDSGPESGFFDDDGYYNSHKSVRSERFHIDEVKNSEANDPIGKHYLTGSYKVHESNPLDSPKTEYHKLFQAPLANINFKQSNYGPTGSEESDGESEEIEGDYDEENDEEGDVEDYDYSEVLGQQSGSASANSGNTFYENVKQYFPNNL